MGIWYWVITLGLPTAFTGFAVWLIQRKINKWDKRNEEKERARENMQLTILKSVTAALSLSEATAKAVQRIPDAKCNGDMHQALDYASKVKREQKEFLTQLGVHALYQD